MGSNPATPTKQELHNQYDYEALITLIQLPAMKYLIQFIIVLAFWAAGEGISSLIGGVVPGSLLGMILLFTALVTGVLKESMVKDACSVIIKYMVLFFVPAAVGIMAAWDIVSANFAAIITAAVVSTILVIVVVGWVQQKLGKRW